MKTKKLNDLKSENFIKLNLDELKVESFMTSLGRNNSYTIKGGDDGTGLPCAGSTANIVLKFTH